jgi:hypothetical protein
LTSAGKRIQAQHVLTGMIIYLAMAIDFPSWALDAIDRIRKGFLWRGHKEVKGATAFCLGEECVSPLRACLGNLRLEWIEVVCGVLKCNMN